jgi:hypothetical protein
MLVKDSMAAAKPHGGLHSCVRATSSRSKGEMACLLALQSARGENCIVVGIHRRMSQVPITRSSFDDECREC